MMTKRNWILTKLWTFTIASILIFFFVGDCIFSSENISQFRETFFICLSILYFTILAIVSGVSHLFIFDSDYSDEYDQKVNIPILSYLKNRSESKNMNRQIEREVKKLKIDLAQANDKYEEERILRKLEAIDPNLYN